MRGAYHAQKGEGKKKKRLEMRACAYLICNEQIIKYQYELYPSLSYIGVRGVNEFRR